MSGMAFSDGLIRRRLVEADVSACLALSSEAGWNQTTEDWLLMLGRGHGFGIQAPDGRMVATAIAHGYGGLFGWISMVLVTPDFRRRGLAKELLARCLEAFAENDLVAGLDATEAGRKVYRTLGFVDVYGLHRLTADVRPLATAAVSGPRPMSLADLPAVRVYDGRAFGTDRGDVLAHLFDRASCLAFVSEEAGCIRGFVLGRDGREATQIGPLSADDEVAAIALLDAALARAAGRVYVDVVDHHGTFRSHLERHGFAPQRPLTRMLRGRADPFDDPARVFAIAGPELG
jgi:GNAT superfamily N-acetyltransferase